MEESGRDMMGGRIAIARKYVPITQRGVMYIIEMRNQKENEKQTGGNSEFSSSTKPRTLRTENGNSTLQPWRTQQVNQVWTCTSSHLVFSMHSHFSDMSLYLPLQWSLGIVHAKMSLSQEECHFFSLFLTRFNWISEIFSDWISDLSFHWFVSRNNIFHC